MSHLPTIESLSDEALWRLWSGRHQGDPLKALAAAKMLQDRMDTQRWAVIEQALAADPSQRPTWHQIGQALGVSRQAAWQGYHLYRARQPVAPAEPDMSRSVLVGTLRDLPKSEAWRGWLLRVGSLAKELSTLQDVCEVLSAWSTGCFAVYWHVQKKAEETRDETALRYAIRIIEGLQGAAAQDIPHTDYQYFPGPDPEAAAPVVPWVPEELAASEAPEAQALTAAANQALQAAHAAAAVAQWTTEPETEGEERTAALATAYIQRLVAYADAGLRVLATVWADRLTQAGIGDPHPSFG